MATIHALIIDDSEIGLKVLASMLEMAGATYTAVQDPRMAQSVFASLQQVDVVFLDLEMPFLNGGEVLHAIRQDFSPQIPFVAYSVHTSELALARDLGFDGFLGKPISMKDFPRQLHDIIAGIPVWSVS